MSEQFLHADLRHIARSPTNPRTHFDPDKLQELADNIKASGVHTPILMRPLPASRVADTSTDPATGKPLAVRPIYELVSGERRYRASQLAAQPKIPAILRDLTDEQVYEIQLTENLQREDLTELEEAEGYQRLMDHCHISADQVAVKIGKGRSYVYGRLKLQHLADEAKTALRSNAIDFSRALPIARIPSHKLQLKALAEATRQTATGEQPSVRALQTWIHTNVMLRLDVATFPIADARLVKSAGSCKTCPKRTGADADVFAEVLGVDLCMDPDCYHGKEDAHREAIAAKAKAKGMELIEGKEAMAICSPNTGQLNGYLPLSQVREDAVGTDRTTLRELLGSEGPAAVMIVNPHTREVIEAVPAAEAEAALVLKGLIKATRQQADKRAQAEQDLAELQAHAKQETNIAVRRAQYRFTVKAILDLDDEAAKQVLHGDVLREWFLNRLDTEEMDEDYMASLLGYQFQDGEDEVDGITMHLRACSTGRLIKALLIHMAHDDEFLPRADARAPHPVQPPVLHAIERSLQISWDDEVKKAIASVKADMSRKTKELKAQIAALTAAAGNSVTASSSAGGSLEGSGEEGEAGAAAPAKKPTPKARQPKMTESEAKSGIAAAMQGMERAATPPPEAVDHEEALYQQAVAVVHAEQKPSISLVQRHLKIGYNAAARLLDRMEDEAIVTPMQRDGNRSLITAGQGAANAPAPVPMNPTEPAGELGVGKRVKVIGENLHPKAAKWAGKEGFITQPIGDRAWDVTFRGDKGRITGIASFDRSELEVLTAATATAGVVATK